MVLSDALERRTDDLRLGADGEAVHAVVAGAALVRRDLHHRRAPEQRIERALRAQMTTPAARRDQQIVKEDAADDARGQAEAEDQPAVEDRKSTRLNSSHVKTSYAVFCLKKKT